MMIFVPVVVFGNDPAKDDTFGGAPRPWKRMATGSPKFAVRKQMFPYCKPCGSLLQIARILRGYSAGGRRYALPSRQPHLCRCQRLRPSPAFTSPDTGETDSGLRDFRDLCRGYMTRKGWCYLLALISLILCRLID